jgi:hypothetical protein
MLKIMTEKLRARAELGDSTGVPRSCIPVTDIPLGTLRARLKPRLHPIVIAVPLSGFLGMIA